MNQLPEEKTYRKLGKKIDNLTCRAPWNETFHSIVKELYTPEEADVVVRMPYTLSSIERISRVTKIEKARLTSILEKLCKKGLVTDLFNEQDGQYYYMPSPMAIGIFEFTMMRRGDDLNTREWARLFHEYFHTGALYEPNYSHGEQISVVRVIPVEETVTPSDQVEFFDYEKASALIDNAQKFAIAFCACRNEKSHIGHKECDVPLETCSLFNQGAQWGIRNNMAREVSKDEMLDNFARSNELGLVFCAYNTKNPFSVCHCCSCCCEALAGVSKFGFNNSITTSTFMAKVDEDLCTGCGTCVDVCPVNAKNLISANDPIHKKKKKSRFFKFKILN